MLVLEYISMIPVFILENNYRIVSVFLQNYFKYLMVMAVLYI